QEMRWRGRARTMTTTTMRVLAANAAAAMALLGLGVGSAHAGVIGQMDWSTPAAMSWTVPDGADLVEIDATGAAGGADVAAGGIVCGGGKSARVRGDALVQPGEHLVVTVGGQGGYSDQETSSNPEPCFSVGGTGGFPDGGPGGSAAGGPFGSCYPGAGGGGA